MTKDHTNPFHVSVSKPPADWICRCISKLSRVWWKCNIWLSIYPSNATQRINQFATQTCSTAEEEQIEDTKFNISYNRCHHNSLSQWVIGNGFKSAEIQPENIWLLKESWCCYAHYSRLRCLLAALQRSLACGVWGISRSWYELSQEAAPTNFCSRRLLT